MATRAIKKLTKKDELKTLDEIKKKAGVGEEDESSDGDEGPQEPVVVNKFNLLNDDEAPSEEANEESEPESQTKAEATKVKKKDKKKNKKKSNANKEGESKGVFTFTSSIGPEDDESAMLNEASAVNEPSIYSKTKHLLQIESKHLNYDNEMIRMFGARIVQNERANAAAGAVQNNQRGMRRAAKPSMFRHNTIVSKKPTWPPFLKAGLNMRLIKDDDPNSLAALATASNAKATQRQNVVEYAFEHSTSYQNLQFAFMNAVETLDHNNIILILHQYSYHVDSLIQMSEVSRIHDDSQMAADLMERALYAIQNSFHPSFNITTRANQPVVYNVLNYNRVENRCIFVALFKHILFISSKACYRTSLELSKLLLSLDIEGDPLAVILLIDLYALRSSQYSYLVDFYEAFDEFKHLSLLPNMAFSVALAHFNLYRQSNNKDQLNTATKMLKDALVKFPYTLMELLEKCGVTPDKQVENSRTFAKTSNLSVPIGLKYMIDLYVLRMYHEWRIPENIAWLESTVKELVSNEKSIESSVNENKKKFKTLFSKAPPNLYRHLILSDYKEIPVHLPPEYPSTSTYVFDPVPPKNPIVSYTRPASLLNLKRTQATGDLNRTDSLLTFFQSLWPNFNAQEPQQQGAGPRGAAAAEAGEGANNNDRFEMGPMVNRLRDFLAQMQQHFPAAPLLDFDPQDFVEDNEDDQDEEGNDEENPGFDNINDID